MFKTWQAAMRELCAHNGSVELLPMIEGGETLPLVRARLLAVDAKDGSLVVEKPTNMLQAEALRKGVAVGVYLLSTPSRMKAKSRVIDVGRFKLNAKTRVTAVRLEAVTAVESAQRRSCFRLSTLGITTQPVKLTHGNWPAGQPPIKATMIDISDRGIGLTVNMEHQLAQGMKDQPYDVSIQLPGEAEAMELVGRVVRVIETAFSTVTLGLQFEFTTLAQQRRVERIVQHFSVAQQRKQLSRMRGAG